MTAVGRTQRKTQSSVIWSENAYRRAQIPSSSELLIATFGNCSQTPYCENTRSELQVIRNA